jgi:putative phage-type endonuclease
MTVMRTMKNKDDWLKIRKLYITGSDVGTILGINPYKTISELTIEKTGTSADKPPLNKYIQNKMNIGLKFEDKLSDIYKGWIQNPYYISECGKYMATCDFVSKDESVLVELKTTTSPTQFEKLKKVPPHIEAQIVHQYICSGAKFERVFLIAYLTDNFAMKIDKAYIELTNLPKKYPEEMEQKLTQFYTKTIGRRDFSVKGLN